MIRSVAEQAWPDRLQPQRLGALDLDLAPDGPGIYAWYAQLALSENDWRPRRHGDLDMAAADLTKAVGDYARIHRPEPLNLRGEGSYGLNWSGTLWQDAISEPTVNGSVSRVETQLGELASQPIGRRLLIDLLRTATPIFASPLYVGVATSLRVRLAEHRADYEAARSAIRNDPSASEELRFRGQSFGARLAGVGVQLEHLECWVLPAADITEFGKNGKNGATSINTRLVAQMAEWVLQRIFQPVLGRQ